MTKPTKDKPTEDKLILYVLMRTDLPDYKAGKSMAQANHAGTKFMDDYDKNHQEAHLMVDEWLTDGGGFGTCVVLGVTSRQLPRLLSIAEAFDTLSAGIHDPTYPICNGHETLTIPVDTCGYVFGRQSVCSRFLGDLSLF